MPNLWPFKPNTLSEILEFGTDVRRTKDGEFRDSLKDGVTKLQLGYTKKDIEAADLEIEFRRNLTGTFYVPLWYDASTLGSALSGGESSLTVDELGDWRDAGRVAIINGDAGEVLEIASHSGGTLSLTGTVASAWPVGSQIVPVVEAYAPDGLQKSFRVNVTDFNVTFVSIEAADLAADNYSNFGSYDVMSDSPAMISSLDGSVKQLMDFIDDGFGAYALVTDESYDRWRGTVAFAEYTRAARWARRQFLHRVRGKDRPFWLPTFKTDLEVDELGLSGSTNLDCVNSVTTPAQLVGRSIAVFGPTTSYRSISSVAIVSGQIRITQNTTNGQSIQAGTPISFMNLVRFDTDRFEINHQFTSDGFFSTFSAPVVEVAG